MSHDRPFVGNQSIQMPGTCEACVWDRGMHALDCTNWIVVALRGARNQSELDAVHLRLIQEYDRLFPAPEVTPFDKLRRNLSMNNGRR